MPESKLDTNQLPKEIDRRLDLVTLIQNMTAAQIASLQLPLQVGGVDGVPAAPTVYDDEFSGVELNSKWTAFNAPVLLAVTNNQLKLEATAVDIGDEPKGILQTLASEIGVFTAKIIIYGNALNIGRVGLIIRTAVNSNFTVCATKVSNTGQIEVYSGYGITNPGGIVQSSSLIVQTRQLYLQFENTGVNLFYRYSFDGKNFIQFFTETKAARFNADALYLGLFYAFYNNTARSGMFCEWIRKTA